MSTTTQNLELFKYDSVADKNRYFNLNDSMNNNWDKIDTFAGSMNSHAGATDNPHSVTKTQVGLGNCNNTSDLNKPISTATQAALDTKANAADVLAALALKSDKTTLHALKGYFDNGEVLTDADGLADVKTYAHSTFDVFKFTVAGSPTITSDGIASGFSSSNYLTTSVTLASLGTNFDIYGKFSTDSDVTTQQCVLSMPGSTSCGLALVCVNSASLGHSIFHLRYYTSSSAYEDWFSTNTVLANTLYFYHIGYKYNGSAYEVKLDISTDGKNWTNYITQTYATAVYDNSGVVRLGLLTSGSPFLGAIDLKQSSIYTNGVPVFSGNKTGLDIINKDYTVEGSSVTITDEGVASGFTTSSYITKSLSINAANKVVYEGKFKMSSASTGQRILYTDNCTMSWDGSTYFSAIRRGANSDSVNSAINIPNTTIDLTKDTYFRVTLLQAAVANNVKIELWNNENNKVSQGNTSNEVMVDNTELYIGTVKNGTQLAATNTSFDLAEFRVIADDKISYRPYLAIPYTESKTGSKIVNSIYRDRVNDMAEQFGFANYYTLDEDNGNFTLPQGEMYGLINKCARDIAHPVGEPFYRFSDEINEDEVRLEGAEVDKGLYLAIEQDAYLSALCTAGSTPNKICLPDFRNRVIYGDVASGYVEPELPNIKGSITDSYSWPGVGSGSGAFSFGSSSGNAVAGNGGTTSANNTYSFNAHNYSDIYKDNGTVKTAGVKARWLVRWK